MGSVHAVAIEIKPGFVNAIARLIHSYSKVTDPATPLEVQPHEGSVADNIGE
jgi:hypothetical protein